MQRPWAPVGFSVWNAQRHAQAASMLGAESLRDTVESGQGLILQGLEATIRDLYKKRNRKRTSLASPVVRLALQAE